jgi:hypothetical protein
MDAFAYARTLQQQAAGSPDAWHLIRIANPSDEDEKAKLKSALDFLGESDRYEFLASGQHPLEARMAGDTRFGTMLDVLAAALLDDVRGFAGPEWESRLSATALVFVPLRDFAGYCTGRDGAGALLGGHVIVLHEGLYFSLKLLAKAFVHESLEGDLVQYRGAPHMPYAAAAECFLRPRAALLDMLSFEGVPPEIEGVLATVQTDIAIVTLQFIVLHEFAHIAAGDLALMDQYARQANAAEPLDLGSDRRDAHWQAEYRADETALRWLCGSERSQQGHWTNFIAIYAFFRWLADIETRIGRTFCPLHPPPALRGERLLAIMKTLMDFDDDAQHRVAWATACSTRWAVDSRKWMPP